MPPPKPLVSCRACSRTWHSVTMADGLRLVGSCPRCGGELVFAQDAAPEPGDVAPEARDVAPHLVLGTPRLG